MALDRTSPGPEYTLRWPGQLLEREARSALQRTADQAGFQDEVGLLLVEAFTSDQPRLDFEALNRRTGSNLLQLAGQLVTDPWANLHESWVRDLAGAVSRMPVEPSSRPYFAARRGAQLPARTMAVRTEAAKHAWSAAIGDLLGRGYLERAAPKGCVDGDGPGAGDRHDALDQALTVRLGQDRPWTRMPESWSEDTFLTLVEAVHDLVARPRRRWLHRFGNCGWHYQEFAVEPAQILYRWTVNRLLASHGIPWQLAKSGEDVGRLVTTPADDRDRLLTAVTASAPDGSGDGNEIRHAVALFRDRGATREHKRSACQSLARILESRKQLIRDSLLRKDEAMLFQLANKFDIRHSDADQLSDYSEAYLDWIYWSFLATVELTGRILAEQQQP